MSPRTRSSSKDSKKSAGAERKSKKKLDVNLGGESSTRNVDGVDAEMDEDKEEKREAKKTFRSRMKLTVDTLNKLVFTERQEAVLKETKFWNFIEAIKTGKVGKVECSKATKALEFIITNFDPEELKFKIGDQVFKYNPNHLSVIFKMQRIKMSQKDRNLYEPKEVYSLITSEFYIKYFLEPMKMDADKKKKEEGGKKKAADKEKKKKKDDNVGDKLWKKYIIEGIHAAAAVEGKEEDLMKLLLLLMFCTMFFINTGDDKKPDIKKMWESLKKLSGSGQH